ncbi:phage late control D family protein [Natrialbaceae archaeon AArc-T1-2]|uniref:phage late control D family protein n=1 Tax=Natrialbaceae archaeon AArc-T1-2 TaxID=3053904 RepID=UPI00255A799B|nr:hypothetical protein [Natrialbaceae archaeon AArc-T1-2]WIV66070.1 hypothetical protein QQ977_10230 [Natrialbaceae archaeon AArc-T1-2]
MTDFEALEEKYDGFDPPRFKIEVGDHTFTDADARIVGISIDTALSETNRVELTIDGGFDPGLGEFAEVDWDCWTIGTQLDVRMGYGDELEKLFHGAIDSVQSRFSTEGGAVLQISGLDPRNKLMGNEVDDSWEDTTVGAVVEDVLETGEYDFPDVNVEGVEGTGKDRIGGGDMVGETPGDLTVEKVFQSDESHYDILSKLADRFGYELFFRGETFHYRRPRWHAEPALELEYGRSLRSFAPYLPGNRRDVGTVVVTDSEGTSKEPISGEARREEGEEVVERTARVGSEVEAEAHAHAVLRELTLGPTNEAEVLGLPDLRIGRPIKVTGVGTFSGIYYVEESTHRLDSAGYTTKATVRTIDA